jgi:hypothetical protein
MKENFLHYVWQYQLFNTKKLMSVQGEVLHIEHKGNHQQEAGPDFKHAKIRIHKQLWAGNVEIHLKSSDWYAHHHETDSAYDNVILHVVWEYDVPVFRKNNEEVSTLELKGLVSKHILENYQKLRHTTFQWIPCENQVETIPEFIQQKWLERLYIERLERKVKLVENLLLQYKNDWERVLFILLAKYFGAKYNSHAFELMAKSLKMSIVRKESSTQKNLEALFYGLCGMLKNNSQEQYFLELKKIYHHQKNKYKLKEITEPIHFYRLRPSNFPGIRLSQLSEIYTTYPSLFQALINAKDTTKIYEILKVRASTFWDTHYVFNKENKTKRAKQTTKNFIDLLIINVIIPIKFSHMKKEGKDHWETLLDLAETIQPEQNHIVKKYNHYGIHIKNALHSQALLTLKEQYCTPQKCLQCDFGNHLLRG